MKAVIFNNGSVRDYSYYEKYFDNKDLLICVDGGAAHVRRFGIIPNVLIGDLDSISEDDLEYFTKLGVEIHKFPVEKDMTDSELAINYAIDKGCMSITIIGGIGTRQDHSLSNIFLLKQMLDKGVRGVIVDEFNEITIIKDTIELTKEENTKVTLLPLSDRVEGVTTRGFYYPLDNATIKLGSTWGVSNEFISDTASVSIKDGLMLVIKSKG